MTESMHASKSEDPDNNERRLYPEDQAKVDTFLKSGVNSVERKPFRPIIMILLLIVVGSLPLIIFGYIIYTTGLIHVIRNIEVIAWMTFIFGIILYFSDKSRFDNKISSNPY